MQIHALFAVRDEADIVAQCLQHAANWCDYIYVYDTGSTDGTWDIVHDLARCLKQVVPYKQEAVWFHDGLRAVIFDRYRERARDGDWFVRLDADEFYPVSPRHFIVYDLRAGETAVWNQTYEFRLTQQEALAYRTSRDVLEDRTRSIISRRRYYIPLNYSEPRMFRYRTSMRWPPTAYFPRHAGFVARNRIPVLHYPHRDPVQMRMRFALRSVMREHMRKIDPGAGRHWDEGDWRSLLIDAYDPRLFYWQPQTALPRYSCQTHLPSPSKRLLQTILYRVLVHAADHVHSGYPAHFEPTPLPHEVIGRICGCQKALLGGSER